jgi:hypothetical protein
MKRPWKLVEELSLNRQDLVCAMPRLQWLPAKNIIT